MHTEVLMINNPLAPKSYKHLISPHNITFELHIKVTKNKGNDHI